MGCILSVDRYVSRSTTGPWMVELMLVPPYFDFIFFARRSGRTNELLAMTSTTRYSYSIDSSGQ